MLVMHVVAKFSLVEEWTKWGSVLHDSYLTHLRVEPRKLLESRGPFYQPQLEEQDDVCMGNETNPKPK